MTDSIDWSQFGYPANIRPFPDKTNIWTQDSIGDALAQIHEATERAAQERIDWYNTKASRFGKIARGIRFVVLLLAGLGALAPLLSPLLEKLVTGRMATIVAEGANGTAAAGSTVQIQVSWITELDAIGIVMIAVAGILVGFDNFFGISQSWMRFRMVQAALVRRFASFRYDWAIALTKLPTNPTASDCTSLLRSQRAFADDLEEAVENETRQWADRLQVRLSAFDKSKGFDQSEEERGSVAGTITNWDTIKSSIVLLTVNANAIEPDADGTFAASGLPVGNHTLKLAVDGKLTEKQFSVNPGETTTIMVAAETN